MIDLNEIEDTIRDLEGKNTTLDNCRILADMITIKQFYTVPTQVANPVEEELRDILPQYKNYCKIKRRYQLGEVSESQVLNSLKVVCKEIDEFFHTLYSSTDMPEEREQLKNLMQRLFSSLNNK